MPKRNLYICVKAIFLILIIIVFFLFFMDHDTFEFIHEDLANEPWRMHSLHDASIIILTIIIACIAWIQLNGLVKTGQAEFLMRIDERLGDKYILKARLIIHDMYFDSKNTNPLFTEKQHREQIATTINSLGYKTDEKSKNNYVILLNFLDFLETASLFTNEGYISVKEINDLLNQSLIYFYDIFEIRIITRRRKYDDPTFYNNFETLVKKIKCRKNHCKMFCFYCYFN